MWVSLMNGKRFNHFCETVDKPTIAFDGHDTSDVLDRILGYITSLK